MKKLKLGKNCKIDKDVKLGLICGRSAVKGVQLVIGNNAIIRSGTVIYSGTKIAENLQTGHNVVIREENNIGNDFSIWSNSIVDYGCKIGNNVKIHSNCYVAQYTVIEDDVFIAPGVVIANDIHPGCKFSKKCMKGPVIKKGTQVGVNTTILPFVTIGRKCLIGAGSVVTKNIPDNSVIYGNPAKVRKKISDLRCIKGITDKPY